MTPPTPLRAPAPGWVARRLPPRLEPAPGRHLPRGALRPGRTVRPAPAPTARGAAGMTALGFWLLGLSGLAAVVHLAIQRRGRP
jgi:hypothetical protein